ncbi:hypothetical protein BB561_002227, partial [Smittium simulii]
IGLSRLFSEVCSDMGVTGGLRDDLTNCQEQRRKKLRLENRRQLLSDEETKKLEKTGAIYVFCTDAKHIQNIGRFQTRINSSKAKSAAKALGMFV